MSRYIKVLAAAIFACHWLAGCEAPACSLQPDGLHTHHRTCAKGKCVVSDCVIHYEQEGINEN